MTRLPFQKKLYDFTKDKHVEVEGVFNFREGINPYNISLFHKTMLVTRNYCSKHLAGLEKNYTIQTYNLELIDNLTKDSITEEINSISNTNLKIPHLNDPNSFNEQLGAFYVLAGSSAGGKMLLAQANKQNFNIPLHYLNHLVSTSKSQMIQLQSLMINEDFEEQKVMDSALAVFNLIYKTALHELKATTSKL